MGRPIKKSHFGPVNDTGYQITVTAHVGGVSAETCTIVSQRGTRKYKCYGLTSLLTKDCFLVDGALGAPTLGQAVLPVTTATSTEYARTLYQYRVKTYTGNTYVWDADGRGAVVVGVGYGGEVPVLVEQATVGNHTVTAGEELAPADDVIVTVTNAGSGYVAGTYTNAVVTGYTGLTAPTVSYVVGVLGTVTSATITHFNTAVENDELVITLPAPAP